MPVRFIVIGFLAIACSAASAQTTQAPPATVTVQQLAPQLVAFAGSQPNFQNLVTGLAQGTPVQLVSILPGGFTQLVTFTPAAALAPADIAGVLERARQQLIGIGIGAPTAEQLAITLMGGTVPTALGGAQVPGVLGASTATTPQSTPSPAAQMQAAGAAGGTAPGTGPATQPRVNVQLIPAVPQATPGLVTTPGVLTAPGAVTTTPPIGAITPRPNTSDSTITPGATSASPIPLIPSNAPGVGSTPPALERVPPGQPAARN